MKRLLVGFVAGLVMATVGVAAAAKLDYVRLHRGQVALYGRVGCQAQHQGQLTCVGDRHHVGVLYSYAHVTVLHGGQIVWSTPGP